MLVGLAVGDVTLSIRTPSRFSMVTLPSLRHVDGPFHVKRLPAQPSRSVDGANASEPSWTVRNEGLGRTVFHVKRRLGND